MTEPTPTSSPWAIAADRLARLATRRARVDAFARPAALALAATGALVLAGKALRALDPTTGWAAAVLGVAGAVAWGARAARRVMPTTRETAAWALDRLAGARERGLTAAIAGEDATRTVAGGRLPPPPSARLRPADGTVLVAVAGLVALAGVLWQGPHDAPPADARSSGSSAARGGVTAGPAQAAAAAARKDADAREADDRATADRRVREALGLGSLRPLDEAEVAARLADPSTRAAALAAAPAGSPAAAALSSRDPGAAAALVRALESGAAAEAERLRAEAASLRACTDAVPIPPTRRAVVARYLSSLAASRATESPPK